MPLHALGETKGTSREYERSSILRLHTTHRPPFHNRKPSESSASWCTKSSSFLKSPIKTDTTGNQISKSLFILEPQAHKKAQGTLGNLSTGVSSHERRRFLKQSHKQYLCTREAIRSSRYPNISSRTHTKQLAEQSSMLLK